MHSSARAFAPDGDHPFRFTWLDWYRTAQPPIDPAALLAKLTAYFDWQDHHYNMTGYDRARIQHDKELATEFLTASGPVDMRSAAESENTTEELPK